MSTIEFSGLTVNFFDVVEFTIPAVIIFVAGALALAAMIVYRLTRRRAISATVKYSDLRIVKRAARTGRQKFRPVLFALRVLAISLLIVALARPRSGTERTEITSEGIDIMIALDVSSSMQAEDFKPHNRLYVAKEEIKKFIERRINDRMGLVVFARHSFTQCPLTVDHNVLLQFVDMIGFGAVEDGTAIGMAIANGVNRLRESDAKSRIMVLLTDGVNNSGEIDPLTAANLAAAFDVKIYTIAAGRPGNAMVPYDDPIFGKRYIYSPTRIDEESLKEIAARTSGRFFRARSGEELEEIYRLIDDLEKTEIKTSSHIEYKELFERYLYVGLALLILELLLGATVLRKLP
jgi:Ca-activated chloride channel family protein